MSECRARAQEVIANNKPVSRVAGVVIVLIWLTLVVLLAIWTYEAFASDCSVPYCYAVEGFMNARPTPGRPTVVGPLRCSLLRGLHSLQKTLEEDELRTAREHRRAPPDWKRSPSVAKSR
jgi:hypothetical protein